MNRIQPKRDVTLVTLRSDGLAVITRRFDPESGKCSRCPECKPLGYGCDDATLTRSVDARFAWR